MGSHEIIYKPTVLAQTARIIIPIMKTAFPAPLYRVCYNLLYSSYKWVLRNSYVLYLGASYFKGENAVIKAKLTWKLLPYTMGGRKALENAFDLVAKVEHDGVPGALVECGVAEGGTAAMLALANKILGKTNREKWFFDSFEGLPEPTEEDYRNNVTGAFIRPLPKGSCLGTIEQVSELMHKTLGLSKKEVRLVKGWFQDTVPASREEIGSIAVLRLDGDWYESTKIPLDNFYAKLSPGGVVIVDDYATCYGSERAVNEFRNEHNISSPIFSDGRGGVWFEKV